MTIRWGSMPVYGFFGVQFIGLSGLPVPDLEPREKEEEIIKHLRGFLIEDCLDILRSRHIRYLNLPADVLDFYEYNLNATNLVRSGRNTAVVLPTKIDSVATEHFQFSVHNRGL